MAESEYSSVHPDNIAVKILEPGRTTFASVSATEGRTFSAGVPVDLGYDGDFFDPEKSRRAIGGVVEAADLYLSRSSERTEWSADRAQKISEYLLAGLVRGNGKKYRSLDSAGVTYTGDLASSITIAGTSEWAHVNGMHWGNIGMQIIRTDHSKGLSKNNRAVVGIFHNSQQLLGGESLAKFGNLLSQQEGVGVRIVDDQPIPELPAYKFNDYNAPPYDINAVTSKMAELGQEADFTHEPFKIMGSSALGAIRHSQGLGLHVVLRAQLPPEFHAATLRQEDEGLFTVSAKKQLPGSKKKQPEIIDIESVPDAARIHLAIEPWVETEQGRVVVDSRLFALDKRRWGAAADVVVAARALGRTVATDRKTMRLSQLQDKSGKDRRRI